jgi:outer membrane lipoprotein-sorting protein
MFRNAFFIPLLFILASIASLYAVAADSCQPLANAVSKLATTPAHIYATTGDGSDKPTNIEMIYIHGDVYGKVGSGWMRTNFKTQDMVAQTQDKQKTGSCQYLKDESIGGETTAVYSERSQSGEAQSQVWISKSRGLLLREETDLSSGGKGATHMSMRYEYANVQAQKI